MLTASFSPRMTGSMVITFSPAIVASTTGMSAGPHTWLPWQDWWTVSMVIEYPSRCPQHLDRHLCAEMSCKLAGSTARQQWHCQERILLERIQHHPIAFDSDCIYKNKRLGSHHTIDINDSHVSNTRKDLSRRGEKRMRRSYDIWWIGR